MKEEVSKSNVAVVSLASLYFSSTNCFSTSESIECNINEISATEFQNHSTKVVIISYTAVIILIILIIRYVQRWTRVNAELFSLRCPKHQPPRRVTFTWGVGWGLALWSRSMADGKETVCAPPTSAWAPGTWPGRSCRRWRPSRWRRRIPTGESGRRCLVKTLLLYHYHLDV